VMMLMLYRDSEIIQGHALQGHAGQDHAAQGIHV